MFDYQLCQSYQGIYQAILNSSNDMDFHVLVFNESLQAS